MAVYVIYTFSGNENKVAEKIRDLVLKPGEDIYIPTYNRGKRIRGRYQVVNAILFPGYIFYETEDAAYLKKRLRKITELTKLLESERYILPISENEERLLYKLCGKEHILDISTGYIEGGKVRVIKGPMMGLDALIKKVNRKKKTAVIEVELLSRTMEITVGLDVID